MGTTKSDMKCLVIGDLHLDSPNEQIETPETWQDYDVIVTVGDVLETQKGQEQRCEFFNRLDEIGISTVVVPGNHDFPYYPEIIDEFPNVQSINGTAVEINDWSFYGLGSDRFDDGAEIRYMEFPELADADLNPARFEQRVEDIVLNRASVDELIRNERRVGRLAESIKLYEGRLTTLNDLARELETEKTCLVTHLPPFGSDIDKLSNRSPRYPGQHLGSIAVRTHLRRFSPSYNFCGHIHEGEGIIELNGSICLNAGERSIYSVEINQGGKGSVERSMSSALAQNRESKGD